MILTFESVCIVNCGNDANEMISSSHVIDLVVNPISQQAEILFPELELLIEPEPAAVPIDQDVCGGMHCYSYKSVNQFYSDICP
jgi:hypothetical protein